jgi:hypothetical protein
MLDTVTAELDRLAAAELESERLEVPAGATSLDFLQAIYRDARQPMSRRMRAAVAALPFEHPKLSVTAVVEGGGDFAARLDLACARSAKVIEARAEPDPPAALPPTDLRLAPAVPDRRFRR